MLQVCVLGAVLAPWPLAGEAATPSSAVDIKAFLAGKAVSSSGSRFALPPDHGGETFAPDGTWRMSGGRGGMSVGKYTVQGDRLCVELGRKNRFCRQVRIEDGVRLYYRDLPDGAWREARVSN